MNNQPTNQSGQPPDAPTFALPTIPPQPPATAPQGMSEAVWITLWQNHRWALQMHSDAACRQAQLAMREAAADVVIGVVDQVIAALGKRREISKDELVLAMMPLVPVAFRSTESNWAQEVLKAADDLWSRMQAQRATQAV